MASLSSSTSKVDGVKVLPQLEGTGADGPSPYIGALIAASRVIKEKHDYDEQNEQENSLSNMLSKNDPNPYFILPFEKSANSSNNQGNNNAWSDYKASPFTLNQRRQFHGWPHEIQQQLKHVKRKPSSGLFPEINCAWITLDNRLYLWNYESNLPLTRYDKLDHIIVSVGLVQPRRGVFKEFVQYILVIATTVEIVLVGVAFEESDLHKRIQLKPTKFLVSADNIFVLKIVGTATGTYIHIYIYDIYISDYSYIHITDNELCVRTRSMSTKNDANVKYTSIFQHPPNQLALMSSTKCKLNWAGR